jgi:hypothetical protein
LRRVENATGKGVFFTKLAGRLQVKLAVNRTQAEQNRDSWRLLEVSSETLNHDSCVGTERSTTTPSQAASAHGAQMAKYFTLNQPPHVAIDSAVSVVRPQLTITRLIARSGIPERTASIPAEKA